MINETHNTEFGIYAPSNTDNFDEMFKNMKFSSKDVLLDAGSGDGRIVFIAEKYVRTIGVEGNKRLYAEALLEKHNHKYNSTLMNYDLNNVDFGKFTHVYCYPDKNLAGLLKRKIKDMKKHSTLLIFGKIFNGNIHGFKRLKTSSENRFVHKFRKYK